MFKNEKFKAYLAWLNVCFAWGTTYLAIRIGVQSMPPMLFAGIRWIVAGLLLISILKIRNYRMPDKDDLKAITIIGIMLLGIGNGLVVVGEQWLPSGITALIITTIPFWVVGFESFIARGLKINLLIIGGMILGFLGVMLLIGEELKIIEEESYLLGTICLLIAVVSWAGGSVYSKYRSIKVRPLTSAGFQMLIAGSAQTLLGIILGEYSEFTIQTDGLLAILYLIFFGSLLGYVSYIYAIAKLPVSFVSTYAYINPIIAVLLGWMVIDESLSTTIVISTMIILSGVLLLQKGIYRQRGAER